MTANPSLPQTGDQTRSTRASRGGVASMLLRWLLMPATLIERARGRRRIALLALYAVIACILGAYVWRASNLIGLPDIGDPFDMKEFLAFDLPPGTNAYEVYKKARANLKALSPVGESLNMGKLGALDWRNATEAQRRWLLANQQALALWMKGADRPDAMALTPEEIAHGLPSPFFDQFPFWFLANLEASRRDSENDMAGAWQVYRAWLRAVRHQAMHGNTMERANMSHLEAGVLRAINGWAADPRVDARLLEQAVNDASEADALIASDLFTLKAEYVEAMRTLDDPQATSSREQTPKDPNYAKYWLLGRERAFPGAAIRFFRGEPELSRRVIRLVFANWIAQVGQPPEKPALRVVIPPNEDGYRQRWGLDLYDARPGLRPRSGGLAPHELGRRILKTWDAKQLLLNTAVSRGSWARPRGRKGDLAYTLAEQWYGREHEGALPPQPEALLGRYLKTLPVPDELVVSDEAVPELEDSKK